MTPEPQQEYFLITGPELAASRAGTVGEEEGNNNREELRR